MNDKELLQKLNNLKTIKPDDNWKKNYREVLYSQISAGAAVNKSESNLRIIWQSIRPGKVFLDMAKPVWVASLASMLILIIGIGGVYASKNSKPGDSLYIAKIISEKAQFAMAFNEKDKAKLGLEFATNRAKEMIQVLQDTGQTATVNNDKLEKLSQNFKKEISQVKTRLTTISGYARAGKAAENQNKKEEEPEVFGANLGKNDQRMEISEPAKPAAAPQIQPSPIATTTPDKALEEAEKLVDEKNINGAINKIEEVKQIINQEPENSESGQVKGASETATSTK